MKKTPYQTNKDVERVVSRVLNKDCYALKTNEYIGCWVACEEKYIDSKQEQLDIALEELRRRYKIFVMAEDKHD